MRPISPVDPGHCLLHAFDRRYHRRHWATDHHNRQAQASCRSDLAVGRAASGIFGHHHIDLVFSKQPILVGFRERSAGHQQCGTRRQGSHRIDCTHQIKMLWPGHKSRQLQASDGEEDTPRTVTKFYGGVQRIACFNPSIAGGWSPGGALQSEKRCAGLVRGHDSIFRYLNSKRMRCINQSADAIPSYKICQSVSSAKAADAIGNGRSSRMISPPSQRDHRGHVRSLGQGTGEGGGFSGATKKSGSSQGLADRGTKKLNRSGEQSDKQTTASREILRPSSRWLTIVGIGEDGLDGLPQAAQAVIGTAELLVGGARHLAFVPNSKAERMVWPSPLTDAIPPLLQWRGRRVVVLASGDPFWWGVGATLARHIPMGEMICLPAPSAFSLAAARIGWPLQTCQLLSLHGRPLHLIVPHIQPEARILALSWDGSTPKYIAERLVGMGFGPSRLTVLERMGGDKERVQSTCADHFALEDLDPLNVVAIEVVAGPNARPLPLATGLPDEMFEHDGQLTKREIRAITLSALQPLKGQLLWDIGLGAGSIAIEWLLCDSSNRCVGIEENETRVARAARNAVVLGVQHLEIVHGKAPAVFEGLEPPDRVFLGGGAGDQGVFDAAWNALKPGGRLVANAVSIETEARLIGWHRQFGGALIRIAIDRAEPVGHMTGWRPAMPITQLCLQKKPSP